MTAAESQAPRAKIYTKRWCGYCFAAKRLLSKAGVTFEEIRLDNNPKLRWRIAAENGGWPTVPMIFIDGGFIGGHSELRTMHRRRRLAVNASSADRSNL